MQIMQILCTPDRSLGKTAVAELKIGYEMQLRSSLVSYLALTLESSSILTTTNEIFLPCNFT